MQLLMRDMELLVFHEFHDELACFSILYALNLYEYIYILYILTTVHHVSCECVSDEEKREMMMMMND